MSLPRFSSRLLGAAIAAASAVVTPAAQAFSPFLVVPEPAVAEATPAFRYANMSDDDAFAECDRRKIIYTKLDPAAAPGVRAPMRLTARLHGVNIHSALPPDQRVVSPYEILDARLALALDDFAALLERHDIDEVVHFTMYRPNVAPAQHGVDDEPQSASRPAGARPRPAAATVTGKQATLGAKGSLDTGKKRVAAPSARQKTADPGDKPEPGIVNAPSKKPGARAAPRRVGASQPASAPAVKRVAKREAPSSGLHQTTWAPPGTRHPAGLAIDVGLLRKRDGRWISVARQFHGHIGDRTCGDGAKVPEDPDARELRALVCEASALGLFTYVLTPDYNAAHADHFHMEIKPGVRWFLTH